MRRVVRNLTPLRRVAVYVSSHGFGHAVRVGEVLGKLAERRPDVTFQVCSTAPRWVFPLADERLTLHERPTDVGMAQHHGLSIDFESTVARLDALEDEWEARASAEASWLRGVGAALVLGDLPPLAFDAARRAGVPALALGNFSWDWIYRSYADRDPRFLRHADRAAQSYASASRLLRLPFHADMSVFHSIVDLPLVARRSPLGRAEARRAIGIETDGPLVLVGFGGLGFPGFDVSRLADMPHVQFVTTDRYERAPANLRILERAAIDYTTLLRASDAIVTKPGWGTVAASLVNGVRVLYTRRGDFPEAPILVDALEANGTAASVSSEALSAGEVREPLERLLSRPVADGAVPADGAERAAEIFAAELGG